MWYTFTIVENGKPSKRTSYKSDQEYWEFTLAAMLSRRQRTLLRGGDIYATNSSGVGLQESSPLMDGDVIILQNRESDPV